MHRCGHDVRLQWIDAGGDVHRRIYLYQQDASDQRHEHVALGKDLRFWMGEPKSRVQSSHLIVSTVLSPNCGQDRFSNGAICQVCGDEIPPDRHGNAKTCSRVCANVRNPNVHRKQDLGRTES